MEYAEGDRSADECKVPSADNDGDVFEPSGSLQFGSSAVVPGMFPVSIDRSVTFCNRLTVYTPRDWSSDDYRAARKGPWMLFAVDRHRFLRRIKQTERNLGDIFSDSHRAKVIQRLSFYAHREKVKRRLMFE